MWHNDDVTRGGMALMWHIGDMAMGDVALCDAPPSSLMDSTTTPKVKTMEGEGLGARSLVRNTLG
jgi:hypothetical protein